MKHPCTLFYSQLNPLLSCDVGKIYNADATICSLLILSNVVCYMKKENHYYYISIQGVTGIV